METLKAVNLKARIVLVCLMINEQNSLWLTFYESDPEQLSVYWLRYMMDDHKNGKQFLAGTQYFSLFQSIKTSSGDQSTSYPMGNGVLFP
jgi:hypothetical protein